MTRQGGAPRVNLASYLSRHEVKITVDWIASGGRTVAEALQQHAAELAADLIIRAFP